MPDVFAQKWTCDSWVWCKTPFSGLHRDFVKVTEEKANMLLVYPDWKNQLGGLLCKSMTKPKFTSQEAQLSLRLSVDL